MSGTNHIRPVQRPARTEDATRPAVLVVEDDDATRELIVTVLDVAGYASDACADTAVALESLRRRAYDLVLTDYALPRQTGAAFLRQASFEGLLDGTPALVVTAHPDPADAAGFEIITKPFDIDQLVARIDQRVGRAPSADRDG